MTKVLSREFLALVALLLSACPLVLAEEPQLKPAIKNSIGGGGQPIALSASHLRKDVGAAKKMAALRWFDKMALADPQLVESITAYSSSASILASHPHLDKIAEADPYLCRRLTRWPGAARVLARNPKAYKVVARDPEGIYRAIKNDRSYAKLLSKNPYFNQMVVENPELGRVLSRYM